MRTRRRATGRKVLKLQTLFFLLLATAAIYSFLQSSFFSLEHIVVTGTEQLDSEEVARLAAVPLATNLWRIDEIQVARNIRAHPMISRVEVRRRLPGTLLLHVNERKAVALLVVDQGFVEVDMSGVALRNLKEISGINLPVITGTSLRQSPTPGELVVAANLDIGLKVVLALPAALQPRIAEVDVSIPDAINLFTGDGIEVRFGNIEGTDQKFQVLSDVLEARSNLTTGYIDVSYPERPIINSR
ncbi:hypothetical protein SY88_03650 [Clostridiales bacterium PH28_bin88]|nr:hypothetical protein SY88_03650 [Clostridiales bacterium PH28_bin88]